MKEERVCDQWFLLDGSWRFFSGNKISKDLVKNNKAVEGQFHPQSLEISCLQKLARRKVFPSASPKEIRYKWDILKYKHLSPSSLCFVCFNQATCRHHIIQISNGGNNDPGNLIQLCDNCHQLIHPWMKSRNKSYSVKYEYS